MKLQDHDFGDILNIIAPFAVGELEEMVSFEKRTDEEREEILKVCMKSLEVGVLLTAKFMKEDSLNKNIISELLPLIEKNKLDQAAEIINAK